MPAHGIMLAAALAVAASGVQPVDGKYEGPVGDGDWPQIQFRVADGHVRGSTVWWQATCTSGRRLRTWTDDVDGRLADGRWPSRSFRYRARIGHREYRTSGRVTGRFRVTLLRGRFTSPISAAGVWRASARLYRHGQRIDACRTGTMPWTAGTLATGTASHLVVPADAPVSGLDLTQWQVRAWQWAWAHQRAHRRAAPAVVSCMAAGQSGPVWFLQVPWYRRGLVQTVSCDVPAGRYLQLPGPSVNCPTVERPPYHLRTDASLRRCAASFKPPRAALAIDGQVVSPAGFPVRTPAFSFIMPAHGNWLRLPGVTTGRAAVAGLSLLLAPLGPGRHTIAQVTQWPGSLAEEIVYDVTVTGAYATPTASRSLPATTTRSSSPSLFASTRWASRATERSSAN